MEPRPRTTELDDVGPLSILATGQEERALLSRSIAGVTARPVRVLEAGCGQQWPIDVDGVDLHITGVDTDAEAMRIRAAEHGDIDEEIVADLRSVELPEASFDVVYCSFVLEHVHGAEGVLDRLVEATKPGGRLIIRIPDGSTVFGFMAKHSPFRVHVLYKRYIEGFKEAGKPGHAPYPTVYDEVVSRRGMRAYAARKGLDVVEEYGRNHYLNVFGKAKFLAGAVVRLVSLVSMGRLAATHNNIGLVLSRNAGS
jgi:SAM-dependent methyltransferase